MKKTLKRPNYAEELLKIIQSPLKNEALLDRLNDYHERDIADALELLSPQQRKKLYPVLGAERLAEIFSYLETPTQYLSELSINQAAKIVSFMDSDDAVDILEQMEASAKEKIVTLMDADSSHDIRLILSYDEDEIGSMMTTNFVAIRKDLSIRQAMRELVTQAGENDNISTVYVVDDADKFYGAIDLKDLIIARETDELDGIISTSYPYVTDHEKIDNCIETIKDYAEDSLPVLTDSGKLIGILTAQDIVEAVDDELGEDYAKLAGLTAEEDLHEKTSTSIKKRLPWLIILLFLGMAVSSVVGVFETVVAVLPIVMCFQSLILDMAGNVGTQSLAVTIRVLMDESLTGKQKLELVWKEMRIAFSNGLILGVLSFTAIGLYIVVAKGKPFAFAYAVSGCIGAALLLAMVISGAVGTCIPLFFKKINVDPAVASGPLITTVNDLVAVVSYYGLSWILLINVLHLAG